MKALSIARKTLRELWREPLRLGLMLFFSVVLVGFYIMLPLVIPTAAFKLLAGTGGQ